MKKIQSICVISPGYPTKNDADYPFVDQICRAIAKHGIKIKVVSPQSVTSSIIHKKKLHPIYRKVRIEEGVDIDVYQPIYISVPNKYKLVNCWFRECSIRFVRDVVQDCDICYCHFWISSIIACSLFKNKEKPIIVATGESDIKVLLGNAIKKVKRLKNIKGVISVSTKNLIESVNLGLVKESDIRVFPNSIDSDLFKKMDKFTSRKKLGFPYDCFIVAYVGGFIERKGVLRLADALSRLDNVYSIFIGKGEQNPSCSNILFKGSVPHENIPLYLNSADIFVLPTLKEGCCNSIIEAMACGLPIVSSDLSFNWDVLDETNSIMVDPNDVDEIANAIRLLKDNDALRKKMSEGSLRKAARLTIENRAKGIIRFIEDKIS